MKKGIKAQGMTFSGTANVSALYRQQKHTHRHRHRHVCVSTTTMGQFRCVQMPEPAVVHGQTGLNEPSKVAGGSAAGSGEEPGDREGSPCISAAGRSSTAQNGTGELLRYSIKTFKSHS